MKRWTEMNSEIFRTKRFWNVAMFVAVLIFFVGDFASFFPGLKADSVFYYVADSDANPVCEIYDQKAKFVTAIPLGFCSFFKNGDVVGKGANGVVYMSGGVVKWTQPARAHHDISISGDESEILVTCYVEEPTSAHIERYECVKIFDRDGNEIFSWTFKDGEKELETLLGRKLHHELDSSDFTKKKNIMRRSHINYAFSIPTDNFSDIGPMWARGNIIVGDASNNSVFIIDRNSGKAVWALDLRSYGYSGPHTPRLENDGRLYFLINRINASQDLTGIGVYDIRAKSMKDIRTFSESLFSAGRSSVYSVESKWFLVTFSVPGVVMWVDDTGKVRDTVFDQNKKSGISPLYRVRIEDARKVDPFLKISGF